MTDQTGSISKLSRIMATLRSPEGCPWDREQDHHTLKQYLKEETAELLDAIEAEDDTAMIEELGDVLLQVVFHAQIANEEERFSLETVAAACCEKLIRRHPHVFADSEVADAPEVLKQWEAIKQREKQQSRGSYPSSALSGVPTQLSALQRAYKVQKKASTVGFDWPDMQRVCHKIEEELSEVTEALRNGDRATVSEEIGDLIFSVTNLSRFAGKNPEELLHNTVHKFERRFRRMEEFIRQEHEGAELENFDIDQLEHYWIQAKEEEKNERTLL